MPISQNMVMGPEYNFGNRYVVPRLSIAKWNDVTGNEEIGNQVLFTIRVTAHENDVLDVIMTDLFSEGFEYVSGSWTAYSSVRGDLKAGGITPEPVYASPADWILGDMVEGEEVILTYLARITDAIDPGTYKDLAWTQGKDLVGGDVLGTAEPEGYVDVNFVGTEVPVVEDEDNPEVKVKTKVEEEVLGAATELPATGSPTFILISVLLTLLVGLGLFLKGSGLKFGKKLGMFVPLVLIAGLLTLSPAVFAVNGEPVISVRLEEPESPKTEPFNITFVAMEIHGYDISAKCLKKFSSDADYSQFGSTIAVTPGGNTYNCYADGSVLTKGGTYSFKVEVESMGKIVESNTVNVDYDGDEPEKPEYIRKEKKSSCKYEVTFKTADDNETEYVEIYRDDEKEYTVSDSKRIKTIDIGPDEKETFTDELYGSECEDTPYYAIRAFNQAGVPSGARSEEITETKTITEETQVTTEALPGAEGGQIGGAGTGGEEVILPGAGEGGEGPSVLGETEEITGTGLMGKEEEEGKSAGSLAKKIFIGAGLLGLILLGYAYKKKDKSTGNPQ
jgi:hypothetical protein